VGTFLIRHFELQDCMVWEMGKKIMGLMRRSLRPPGGRMSSWGKAVEFGDGLCCLDSNGKCFFRSNEALAASTFRFGWLAC
jgi:hypothetical protein